ncbi:protein ITPRID2 isoform X3 [Vicugna pacos]|uniref:Protein ITPRID2 isoform X3 n=1 Tax=Vicugna pacos TaxID=30538 RepID=A0ABM5D8X9_VICPA
MRCEALLICNKLGKNNHLYFCWKALCRIKGSGWGCGAPGAAMDQPLVASAEAEEELEWQVASRKRKAWAKCRGSWQASETEDLSTEATTQDEDEDDEEDLPGTKLRAAAGRGNVPNEKIAIWLKDCR